MENIYNLSMSYHNLNTLTIFPQHLRHNREMLEKIWNMTCAPVIKSNAYGHGLKLLAKEWNKYDIPFVCVDSLFEAYELRRYGYKKEVLIMGFIDPDDIPREKKFHYACPDIAYAHAVIKKYKKAKLHLFLDTGMHREGMQEVPKEGFIPLKKNIIGVMTHLSTPDNPEISQKQIDTFEKQLQQLEKHDIYPEFQHICASWGIIWLKKYTWNTGNIARTGLAYYGYGHQDLLPALRCHTRLMQIKEIHAGESVGYDGAFTAKKSMKIGVLPMGYNDGLDRRFSNIGHVMIRDFLCPILGKVSMNITMIDISKVIDPVVGEEVTYISEDTESPVSLEKQAKTIGVIPYDLLVHLNKEMYRKIG